MKNIEGYIATTIADLLLDSVRRSMKSKGQSRNRLTPARSLFVDFGRIVQQVKNTLQ